MRRLWALLRMLPPDAAVMRLGAAMAMQDAPAPVSPAPPGERASTWQSIDTVLNPGRSRVITSLSDLSEP